MLYPYVVPRHFLRDVPRKYTPSTSRTPVTYNVTIKSQTRQEKQGLAVEESDEEREARRVSDRARRAAQSTDERKRTLQAAAEN